MKDGPKDHSGLVKVCFVLEPDGELSTESLWAEKVADGQYRLQNSPFFAYDVSFEDVVFARVDDGILTYTSVAARGGHSTYRVMWPDAPTDALVTRYWMPIQSLGCSYEGATKRFWSIDVPASVDVYNVYELLERGETDGVWKFEEAHCGHPLKDRAR